MSALPQRKYTLEEWIHNDYKDLDDVVTLSAIGCELTLREIYENLSFD